MKNETIWLSQGSFFFNIKRVVSFRYLFLKKSNQMDEEKLVILVLLYHSFKK